MHCKTYVPLTHHHLLACASLAELCEQLRHQKTPRRQYYAGMPDFLERAMQSYARMKAILKPQLYLPAVQTLLRNTEKSLNQYSQMTVTVKFFKEPSPSQPI